MTQADRSGGFTIRPTKAAAVALAVAALGLFVLSVSGGQATAATAAASGARTVTMDHFKFSPSGLHVAKGTRVVFANTSKVTHTATLKGSFDTGRVKPGKAVAVNFTAKGTYAYRCTLHPKMRGTIEVG